MCAICCQLLWNIPWGIEMVSVCTVPARGGRSCEHFGGYKTLNRIPLNGIWQDICEKPAISQEAYDRVQYRWLNADFGRGPFSQNFIISSPHTLTLNYDKHNKSKVQRFCNGENTSSESGRWTCKDFSLELASYKTKTILIISCHLTFQIQTMFAEHN